MPGLKRKRFGFPNKNERKKKKREKKEKKAARPKDKIKSVVFPSP